jgi:hypothetical protein
MSRGRDAHFVEPNPAKLRAPHPLLTFSVTPGQVRFRSSVACHQYERSFVASAGTLGEKATTSNCEVTAGQDRQDDLCARLSGIPSR